MEYNLKNCESLHCTSVTYDDVHQLYFNLKKKICTILAGDKDVNLTDSFLPSYFQKNIYFCFIDYVKAFDCVDQNKLWKILKGMGIPDHLTCLLRNLYAGQEATVRTGHGTPDWFQIGKGVCHGCISSTCLFNLYAEYIMKNIGLEEAQAKIKIAGEITITSHMQMTLHLWQKEKKN